MLNSKIEEWGKRKDFALLSHPVGRSSSGFRFMMPKPYVAQSLWIKMGGRDLSLMSITAKLANQRHL